MIGLELTLLSAYGRGNIINSRPLTNIPILAEEDEPITLNHFLIGCVNSTQTPHPDETSICLRKQWS